MTMTSAKEVVSEPVLKQEYAGVKLVMESYVFPEEKLRTTPSELDGLGGDAEEDLRLLGCEYIQIAGIMLRVPQVAMATAQVLFQRFYFIKSFVKNRMEEVAMACIWLASKVEEAPRRLRDVLNVFYHFKQRLQDVKEPISMPLDSSYISLKNNVIKAERRLLKELGFCVHIKHPHKIIVMYLQVLEMQANKDLVQTAWNYMNDSLRTIIFVKYSTETISCACIYLAARILQVPLPNQPHWFYLFGATEEEIQDICVTLMRVYQHKKQPYSVLEARVEECQKILEEKKQKAREALGLETNTQSTNNSPAGAGTIPVTGTALNPSPKKESVKVPEKRSSKSRGSNHREERESEERDRRRNDDRGRHKRADKYERRHHSKHSRKHHRHRDESGKRSRSSMSPDYKKSRKNHSSRSSSNR